MDRHRLQGFDAAHGGLATNGTEERVDTGESLESRLPAFDFRLRQRRSGQETPAQGHLLLAMPVGEQTVVADADEAIG